MVVRVVVVGVVRRRKGWPKPTAAPATVQRMHKTAGEPPGCGRMLGVAEVSSEPGRTAGGHHLARQREGNAGEHS